MAASSDAPIPTNVVPGKIHLANLQGQTGHSRNIVLNPRPSGDPEDPLNHG